MTVQLIYLLCLQLQLKMEQHAIRCFPAGSFAVHIGDHLRSNLGIICGAVQLFPLFQVIVEFVNINVSCINLLILISKEMVG